MPSLTSTITAFLWAPKRILPDVPGLHGYNVYEASVRLQGSDIPVSVAHYTREKTMDAGVLARIDGSIHVKDKSLLVVATAVLPVSFTPLPGPLPRDYDLLPRVVFSGVVSSEYARHPFNPESFAIDITIHRPDVWPPVPAVIMACVNRDANRLKVNAHIAPGTHVWGQGIVCGWSGSDKPMLDIQHIDYNYTGEAPRDILTDALNPFKRAQFVDGWANFDDEVTGAVGRGWDILSFSAIPTRIARPRPSRLNAAAHEHAVCDSAEPAAGHTVAKRSTRDESSSATARDGRRDVESLVHGWKPGDASPTRPNVCESAVIGENEAVAALLSLGESPVGGGSVELTPSPAPAVEKCGRPPVVAMGGTPEDLVGTELSHTTVTVQAFREAYARKRRSRGSKGDDDVHAQGRASAKRRKVTLRATAK